MGLKIGWFAQTPMIEKTASIYRDGNSYTPMNNGTNQLYDVFIFCQYFLFCEKSKIVFP